MTQDDVQALDLARVVASGLFVPYSGQPSVSAQGIDLQVHRVSRQRLLVAFSDEQRMRLVCGPQQTAVRLTVSEAYQALSPGEGWLVDVDADRVLVLDRERLSIVCA